MNANELDELNITKKIVQEEKYLEKIENEEVFDDTIYEKLEDLQAQRDKIETQIHMLTSEES